MCEGEEVKCFMLINVIFSYFLVIQRIEDNCVNLLELNGLLFCYGCCRLAGYRLDGGDGILVLINVRSNLNLPHRVNTEGDRMVILSSNYEREEVLEMANEFTREFSRKRAREGNSSAEPPAKYARFATDEVINLTEETDQQYVREDNSFGESSKKFVNFGENEVIDLSGSADAVGTSSSFDGIKLEPLEQLDGDLFEIISIPDSETGADDEMIYISDDDGLSAVSSEHSYDFVSNYGGISPNLNTSGNEYNGVSLPDYDEVSIADSMEYEERRAYSPIDYYGRSNDFTLFAEANSEIDRHLANFNFYNRNVGGNSGHGYVDDFDLTFYYKKEICIFPFFFFFISLHF